MKYLIIFSILLFISCKNSKYQDQFDPSVITKSSEKINVNGHEDEKTWSQTQWRAIDNVWLGEKMKQGDLMESIKCFGMKAIFIFWQKLKMMC